MEDETIMEYPRILEARLHDEHFDSPETNWDLLDQISDSDIERICSDEMSNITNNNGGAYELI